MTTYWIVVANASKASIIKVSTKDYQFHLLATLQHPESRLKNMELHTDRPGHYQARDEARGAYEESMSPKQAEADIFAREIANRMEQGKNEHQFSGVIICASPHFYGLLDKHLTDYTRRFIKHIVRKDYTVLTLKEIDEALHSVIYKLSHQIVES